MTSAAAQTQQQPPKRKVLTLAQEEIVREFCEDHGLSAKQISFEGAEAVEPIFDFDALSLLALKLGDIPYLGVEPGQIDSPNGIATSMCEVRLSSDYARRVFGSSLIGEVMPDGEPVADLKQALDISQARALRKGLRAVGFDPLKEHYAWKAANETLVLNLPSNAPLNEAEALRKRELAEIHILAKDAALINDEGDKTRYYAMLNILFPETTSATEMDEVQRSQWIAALRGLKRSRTTQWGATHPALRANAEASVRSAEEHF
jgi:hypothetical protein